MYPKDTHQPMKENQLCTGHLEQTSIAYASAKYAGVQMCKSMNEQKEILEQYFNDWKGSLEQVDDVCVIGVRV